MHTLHTTRAFVLQRYPQGESNYTYKLLTHNLGQLYAHAQGVRELKSRNRYALRLGQLTEVTLVKGRETWRITGAQDIERKNKRDVASIPAHKRKVFSLVSKLLPVEDDAVDVFELLERYFHFDDGSSEENRILIEAITLLQLMDTLGYVARPITESSIKPFLDSSEFSPEILRLANKHKQTLISRVNSALEVAK